MSGEKIDELKKGGWLWRALQVKRRSEVLDMLDFIKDGGCTIKNNVNTFFLYIIIFTHV